jgi:hypothetical protein
MKLCVFTLGLLLVASFAFGADVDGKWTTSVAGMDGNNMTITYTFKADGSTLTGTSSVPGPDGKDMNMTVKDGKINGNNISFTISFDMGGQEMKMEYKGVVSPDQIKLSTDMMGQAMEQVLKRAK